MRRESSLVRCSLPIYPREWNYSPQFVPVISGQSKVGKQRHHGTTTRTAKTRRKLPMMIKRTTPSYAVNTHRLAGSTGTHPPWPAQTQRGGQCVLIHSPLHFNEDPSWMWTALPCILRLTRDCPGKRILVYCDTRGVLLCCCLGSP
jgi:hypothetical protein